MFAQIAFFVLSDLFKGSWKGLTFLDSSILERLVVVFLVGFERSKRGIDHTVNYIVIIL